MRSAIESIDRIPWPIVALSGIIGTLVLIRYLHLQLGDLRQ